MNKVNPKHDQECSKSAIAPDLIKANIISFGPGEGWNYINSGGKMPRRNAGRFTDTILRIYSFVLESGGWTAEGINPITGEVSLYYQSKFDTPRRKWDKDKKCLLDDFVKYEGTYGVDSAPFFLKSTPHTWQKVAKRYNVALPDDFLDIPNETITIRFWQWVKDNPQITPWITEGTKKALSLLSQGIVACALPGINNWHHTLTKQLTGDYELHPFLAHFNDGRDWFICFDKDSKPKTIKNVNRSINYLIETIEKTEANCTIRVAEWDGSLGKGIDDYLANGNNLDDVKLLTKGDKFKLAAHKQWREYKKFTPDHVIHKQYLDKSDFAALDEDDIILLIKSGLGTGKTTALIDHLLLKQSEGMIGLGYRNSLLYQFRYKAGEQELIFNHLHDDGLLEASMNGYLKYNQAKILACIESLLHFPDESFRGKTLIFDEIVSILKALLFSKTIDLSQLRRILDKFTVAIRYSRAIVCMDANLTDYVERFFSRICPEKRIIKVENTYRGKRPKINLFDGALIEGDFKANDLSYLFKNLLDNADKAFVVSDSQILCEALGNLREESGHQVIRVDSKSITDKDTKETIKAFMSNPSGFIEKHNPSDVITSPTAESGLDVPVRDYFTDFFAFLYGVLDADSILQIIMRLRDPDLIRSVFVRSVSCTTEQIGRRSPFPNLLKEAYSKMMHMEFNLALAPDYLEQCAEIWEQIQFLQTDPYMMLAHDIESMWNHERSYLRECVSEMLTNNGFEVEALTLDLDNDDSFDVSEYKLAQDSVTEEKTEVKVNNSENIYNAPNDYVGKSFETKLSSEADWYERCKLFKAKILDGLPGLHESDIWNPETVKLIRYSQPKLVSQLELRYLMYHPQIAKQLAESRFLDLLDRAKRYGELLTPWRMKNTYLTVVALIALGIDKWIENYAVGSFFETEYTANHPIIKEIVRRGKQQAISEALGRSPGKDKMKYVNAVLSPIGVQLYPFKKKINGEAVWVYRFKPIDFYDLGRNSDRHIPQFLQFIRTKFSQKLVKIQTEAEKRHQTYTEQGIDPVADPPIMYTNNSPSATTSNPYSDKGLGTFSPQTPYSPQTERISPNEISANTHPPLKPDKTASFDTENEREEAIAAYAITLEDVFESSYPDDSVRDFCEAFRISLDEKFGDGEGRKILNIATRKLPFILQKRLKQIISSKAVTSPSAISPSITSEATTSEAATISSIGVL